MVNNPVWLQHLVHAWHQTCSLGQILKTLSAVWIVKLASTRWAYRLYLLPTTQLLPELAQFFSIVGKNGFLVKDGHLGRL